MQKDTVKIESGGSGESSERFWEVEDTANLHHDQADAIGEYLDDMGEDALKCLIASHAKLTLVEFKHAEVDPASLNVLNRLLEYLDEEYGDEEGGWTDPTPAMLEAEKAFVKVVLSEYEVWQCVATGVKEEVDIEGWVKQNHPEWLAL